MKISLKHFLKTALMWIMTSWVLNFKQWFCCWLKKILNSYVRTSCLHYHQFAFKCWFILQSLHQLSKKYKKYRYKSPHKPPLHCYCLTKAHFDKNKLEGDSSRKYIKKNVFNIHSLRSVVCLPPQRKKIKGPQTV